MKKRKRKRRPKLTPEQRRANQAKSRRWLDIQYGNRLPGEAWRRFETSW